MNCLHCICCCFIRNRKAVIRRPLAIKYWDDPDELKERPKTPDPPKKRKKRANLMGGITNLKHSTRRMDEDDEDDDEDDDDVDEVEALLEEGVKKSSIFYYFNCFRSKKNNPIQKEKKKRKKKRRKKKNLLNAEVENDVENDNPEVDGNNDNDIVNEINNDNEDENDENDETKEEETKDEEDTIGSKSKDPKVDAYKEKKKLRKLQKEQAKLQKKAEEEEAARLASMKVVEEVEEEYSKYHSVQHFPLGTSLLDIAAEQEKFKIETKKWRTYKRRQDKKNWKANGWEDRIILNSGCPKEYVPEGYMIEELAPPALDLKYINHRKVMFHWYDDELKPPVHGWFQGIICSAKKHGFNFCIKYDLETTKNKHVNGVIGTILSFEGENAYGLRWSILKPANSNGDIYSEDLKFNDNADDADKDETKNE